MKSLIIHGNKLLDCQKQLDAFLKTNPTIIKLTQCAVFDPQHKEIDFILTIIYKL